MLNIGNINRQPIKRSLKKRGEFVRAIYKAEALRPVGGKASHNKALNEEYMQQQQDSLKKQPLIVEQNADIQKTERYLSTYDKRGVKTTSGHIDISV